MIRVDNLMIGDWIKINHNNRKVKVTAVYDKLIDTTSVSPLMGDEVSPIHLTKEILERNGFTQRITCSDGYYNAPVPDMDDVLFHASEDTYEDTWHIGTFTDHNDNEYALFNLCFVHEAQHALRVCGLNELADNFKVKE